MSLFSRVSPPSASSIRRVAGRVSGVVRGAPQTGVGRKGQTGQALPLFVLMIFVLTGSVAVVTDVSWFWVNQQKMQRAADAGALAGAVFLPGDPSGAYSAARAATARNGYTDGVGGVLVTPAQEATNKRRLDVSVSGPIGTYFARVFGMNQVAGSAQSKAEFTLPVPMGSPQNYYGVGDFMKTTTTVASAGANSGWDPTSGVPNTVWTNPTNANGTVDANLAVSPGASLAGTAQQWNFANPLPSLSANQTLDITGMEVNIRPRLTGSGNSSACQLRVDLSWNGGSNWSTVQTLSPVPPASTTLAANSAVNATTVKLTSTIGYASGMSITVGTGAAAEQRVISSISSPNVTVSSAFSQAHTSGNTVEAAYSYGTNSSDTLFGHQFVGSDFSALRARLTWISTNTTNCPAQRTVSIDTLEFRVTWNVTTTTTVTGLVPVPNPSGGSLTSQGFWGAIITKGGSRENGDEFSPINDNSGISGHTSTNPEQDDSGYDYAVILPGGNGQVKLWDATFCETGSNGAGGNMGAGDHWVGGSANGVTTLYTLWNENGTPYNTGDDTLVATSGNTFANEIQADYSGAMGTPGHSGLTDCSANIYHNAWWTFASGLAAGRYRMNVTTSSANNLSTNAENMWSAWVTSSGATPQVYGEAKMVAYNNLVAGTQLFYLAQIDASNAGKTMEISLFDPGDVSGDAFLRIKSPDGNAYNYATFSWTADDGTSGTNVTSIQTASSGGSLFNDRLITIDVPLPNTYGSVGLTPAGETSAGWWKIEYQVNGGNDTTTWQVSIKGSPVHLVR